MAKFGYACKCGWRLNRGQLTRNQYASAKKLHAEGRDSFLDKNGNEVPEVPGCVFLMEELRATGYAPVRKWIFGSKTT